jgi:hypothetical protein
VQLARNAEALGGKGRSWMTERLAGMGWLEKAATKVV